MRCRPYIPSPYIGKIDEKIIEHVRVLSVKWGKNGVYRQYGRMFQLENLLITFIDSRERLIVTKYTGKKGNIRGLKAGDSIKIEGIVRSHGKNNNNNVTIVSHVKNISG